MKLNNFLILLFFVLCSNFLLGLQIINKTGQDIYFYKYAEEKQELIKLNDGQAIKIYVNHLFVQYDWEKGQIYFFIGSNSDEIALRIYLPKRDLITNLTIIKDKKDFIAYDSTKQEKPIIEEENYEAKPEKNKYKFFTRKKTIICLIAAAIMGGCFYIKNKNDKQKIKNNP